MNLRRPQYLLLLLAFILCGSCGQSQDGIGSLFGIEPSSDHIKAAIAKLSGADSTSIVAIELQRLYEDAGYKAIWTRHNKLTDRGSALLASIAGIKDDGLDPERYAYTSLAKAFAQKDISADSLATLDVQLSRSAILAARDLVFGILNPKEVDKDWHVLNDSTFSVLKAFGKDWQKEEDALAAFRPQNPRYALQRSSLARWTALKNDSSFIALQNNLGQHTADHDILRIIALQIDAKKINKELINQYKYLNNSATNGKIDDALISLLKRSPDFYINKLRLNLERLRWLPNTWSAQYIWVSIPQAEVDYFVNNESVFHNATIVGSKSKHTPSLQKPMQNIVICPPWNLPSSIVKHDYNGRIPGKYQVFKGGKRVPNSVVNSSNYKNYTVRQPPGPSAALGYIKFNLPNEWDIYLHDTPNRSLFANSNRMLSHGCVRVKDPQRLAALILGNKGVTTDSIGKLITKNKTIAIKTEAIPVYIVYMTVGADSSLERPIYLKDSYGKDSVMAATMLSLIQ